MKQRILLLLMGCARLCSAQIFETFDAPDIPSGWVGTDSIFVVNSSQQLQLNASSGGEAYLSKMSSTSFGEWEFWCRFQFSPSTSNWMRWYLMSDTSALNSSVHGYYIQMGGITGNHDSITLCRQDGAQRSVMIGGRVATVSKSDNLVRIKVQRTEQGLWQLFSDTTGKHQYVLEGTAIDEAYTTTKYVGVYTKYSSSNGRRMYWDDVYVGDIRVDEEGPQLLSVQIVSPTQLLLGFDEILESTSALNPNAYELNNGVGYSVAVGWGEDQQTVLLDLKKPMDNQTYSIVVGGLQDQLGNTTDEQSMSFVYYRPKPNDIIISEWLPDPSPTVGLPDHEFVELYNHTQMNLVVGGWKLSDGTTTVVLPDDTVYADSFAIVCAFAHEDYYKPFGQTIGVGSLPSLNNSGDHLSLLHKDGTVVFELKYDDSWYHDELKSNGGYSIELNSPNQLCKGKYNAGASDDESGGTPGRANSRWTLESDMQAPFIVWNDLVEPNHLRIVWNEPMDSASLFGLKARMQTTDLSISSSVKLDTVDVWLETPLHKDSVYQLNLIGAKDCSGNEASPVLHIQYLLPDTPHLFDVLITEVMPDPDPRLGLPEVEYIELHNRSDRLISLSGWTLSDGTSTATLPNQLLFPDSFVVVVSSTKVSQFNPGISVLGVTNFPSLANETDSLWLRTPDGLTVSWLVYQSSWHTQSLKRNGGWSLEMVDVSNPCGLAPNWNSSINITGGTPGKPNSIKGISRDKQTPNILRVYPKSTNELKLYLSECIDSSSTSLHRFLVSHLTPIRAEYDPVYRSIILKLNEHLVKQQVYSLTVDSISDCVGNHMQAQRIDFGLPEIPDSGDVVINEILFNPTSGGADFVELCNRSERVLDAHALYLANRNSDGQIDQMNSLVPEGFLWFPHQYLVCSPDIHWLKHQYAVANPDRLIQTTLPSLNDDAGNCVLLSASQVLDELVYDEKMHLGILDNPEGISLERIDFNRPTNDRSNWTSASTTSGFATPTSRNSQYATTSPTSFIKADPSVFSPDGDGYKDVVNFSYSCESVGSVGSFWVYNAAGQLVKGLVNNLILGTEGVFSWDGITDKGDRAPMGIYIGYFEVFNPTGKVDSEKITFVVASKL